MIKVVLDGGLYCPKFFCDYCEEEIQDVAGAIYVYDERPAHEGEATGITILHKGACDRADGRRGPWNELRNLLVYLTVNSGYEKPVDYVELFEHVASQP